MNSMGVCRSDTPIEQNVKKNIEKNLSCWTTRKNSEYLKKTLKIYDAHLPMSLNRDMACASVFARRNAFGIGHFAACFFWRCVSNFFLAQTHGVISSKMLQNPFHGFLRSQSIQRGGSSCANALRVIQGDFEAAKMTNHPRPTDCPLEGAQSQGDWNPPVPPTSR